MNETTLDSYLRLLTSKIQIITEEYNIQNFKTEEHTFVFIYMQKISACYNLFSFSVHMSPHFAFPISAFLNVLFLRLLRKLGD